MDVAAASVRAPTIKDVASAAGVAVGTVSRVLNAEPTVNAAIRDSVLNAIRDLNYRPSPLARNLRRGSAGAIGLVLADLSTPAVVPAVPVAQRLARAAGKTLIVVDSHLDRSVEATAIRTLLDMQVDGLLWKPLLPIEPDLLTAIGNRPVFLIGPVLAEAPLPYVGVNITDAANRAVEAMLDAGHRRFAVVSVTGLAAGTGFVHGLRTQLEGRGAVLVSDSSWTFASRDQCAERLPGLLDGDESPTAIIVVSTLLAATLIAARRNGMVIPEDLAVVVIGDSELAEAHDPAVDTITMEYDVQVAQGMRELIHLLDGNNRKHGVTIRADEMPKGRYIARDSVRRLVPA